MTNVMKRVTESLKTAKEKKRDETRQYERELAQADRLERAVAHFLYHHAQAVLAAAGKGNTISHLYWAQDLIRQIEDGGQI